MMSSVVAPREVLEAEASLKENDDDTATVEVDLHEEKAGLAKKLDPIETFNPMSTWKKIKEAVQDSQIPLRTAFAAIMLLIVGVVLLILGFISAAEGHGLSHLFLGMIAFIPGSYASFQLYGAYQGWRGYEFQNLPAYEVA